MTVGELKVLLNGYHDSLEIVNRRMSDFEIITASEWEIIKGVHQSGGWVMRSHLTMSEKNKRMEKEYLSLEGN